LNNIGQVYDALGEKQKALEFYNQSLPLSRAVGDRSTEAATLNNIGAVYFTLGEKQKALSYYNLSLPLLRAVGNKSGEAATLGNLADLERSKGNLKAALTHMEASLKIIEDLRTKIVSPELRTSYFASVQDYYQFYIDLLMQLHKQQPNKGYDALALQANERARARTLIELLTESNADIRQGVSSQLLQQEQTLLQKLQALEKRRIEVLSGKPTPEQVAALDKENSELQAQYQQIQTQIRAASPRYAALKYPQPLTVAQIQQQVLDDNTVLLEYSLGEERSYVWVVTKTSLDSYELPKGADIEAATKKFYQLLTDRRSVDFRKDELEQTGKELSKILLNPVAKELGQKSPNTLGLTSPPAPLLQGEGGKIPFSLIGKNFPPALVGKGGRGVRSAQSNNPQPKRLVIVADGALEYIPFAALPAPNSNRLLLVDREVINLPSASTLATIRQETKGRKPAPKSIAVLADPVFTPDDPRLKPSAGKTTPANAAENLDRLALTRSATESEVEFARLPNTRTEAEEIAKLIPATDLKLDFAANLTTATSPQLSQYRIVHFATHGILNSVNPELSGVVLSLVNEKGQSENGFLRLRDIFNLNLPADLVVLSACQTGLGKEIRGEGIVGLTRGFMYAGSPRLVVSLWNVNDAATAKLMTKLYQGMLSKGLPPAVALRQAQLEMLKQPEYQAPYYWAAFVMQGEWN
nr:CHAT domain-containing protein [Cyanosarcina radialis HA8281-LM2]